MQINLPHTPLSEIMQLPVSTYTALTETDEWKKSIIDSMEQKRFEILIKGMNDSVSAITKTLANVGTAIIKSGH